MRSPTILPPTWVLIPCPECDGDGYVEQAIPGGYFDTYQECWYPLEEEVPCPHCHGECLIEVTFDLEAAELELQDAA